MTDEQNNQQPLQPTPPEAAPQQQAGASVPDSAGSQMPAYQQAAPYQQPPMNQHVPPQPMYGAPQPQPVYAPAPLMQLTGGMKFAWLVVGALMGIPGIIIAWLVNVDKMPQVKSDALKFAIIGFVIWIVIGLLIGLAIGGMISAVAASVMGYGGYGHGYYWDARCATAIWKIASL